MQSDNKHIQSTETSFALLEHIKQAGNISLSELADVVDRPKSTVHRHLLTLVELGYVQKEDNEFRLSLQFLDFGDKAREQYPLYSVVRPEVDELVENTGERAQVMVSEGNYGTYIYQRTGDRGITTDSHVGKQVMLHSVASGKAYLSRLPKERVREILAETGMPAITSKTITDEERLFEELETIRERGYAFNDEENGRAVRAVGAPICRDDETVIGALSFAAPKTRLHGELYRETIPERVSDIAMVLGVRVTYE
jgi:DNA-binding IclR family transcriptional regulator